jgi:hypothetical protein
MGRAQRELVEWLLREYLAAQLGSEAVFTVSKVLRWARRRRGVRIPPALRVALAPMVQEFREVVDARGRKWVLKRAVWQRRWNNGWRRFTYVRVSTAGA